MELNLIKRLIDCCKIVFLIVLYGAYTDLSRSELDASTI